MRITAIVALFISSLLANPYIDPDPANTGEGALMLWPTATSTALAGAMTGLADEADATYFNSAGLAFQTTSKANLDYGSLLPGVQRGMYFISAAAGAPLRMLSLRSRNVYVSGSLVYSTAGKIAIVDDWGRFLGRVNVWRGNAAGHMAMLLTNSLGAGIGLKVVHNSTRTPEYSTRGPIGEATGVAVDLAILYRPLSQVSIGATVSNLGPTMVYRPSGGAFSMPRIARLGLCWTPVENRKVRLRVMPELDKLLVGMFRDTTGRKPFGRKLEKEWKDAWKALGVEATAFRLVSLRLGYFEDLTDQLGGIVLVKDGQTYHYGLWDALSRKGLGQLKSIGLCWGFGVGNNTLRFDISSDAAIYDFPTSNWKLQLTCNDIGRLF